MLCRISLKQIYKELCLKDKNILSRLMMLKGGFVDILLVAIALSLSVGIFGSVSIELFDLATLTVLIISLISVLLLVIFLAHRILKGLERTIRYKGSLVFRESELGLIPVEVPEYEISENVTKYLMSAFSENPALKKIWDDNPIECIPTQKGKRELNSNSLISQVIEYVILDELSMHIEAYFANNGIDHSVLKEHSREDLPDFLFKNKFFDLFTKPMNERTPFMNHDENSPGRVVWASGEGGAIFNHFELILPEGALLKRANNGAIRILTKVFELSIRPRFEGYGSVWPRQFEQLYLGLAHFDETHTYQFNLDIEIKFNQFSLLAGKGWEYYGWADSLLDKLESYVDDEKFLENIGWKTVYTSHLISENLRIMPNKSSKKDAQKSSSSS